jgi:protein tyrosine phosphatase
MRENVYQNKIGKWYNRCMITLKGSLISFYESVFIDRLQEGKTGKLDSLDPLLLNGLKKTYWEISGKPNEPDFGEKFLVDKDLTKRAFVIDRFISSHFIPQAKEVVEELKRLRSELDLELVIPVKGMNRHCVPYPSTLVSWEPYLNASFVFDRSMIVGEAPLREQTAHFWDMAACHGIETVISLWGDDAEGYFQYYPSLGDERWFFEGVGSIVCTSQEEWSEWDYGHQDALSVREFAFDDRRGKTHYIRHIQVHTWRDMTSPTKKLMSKILDMKRGKPLIHCTAGIGRSGVTAALIHIKENGTKVIEAVRSLRDPLKGRCPNMIEQVHQYFFLQSMLKDI